MMDMKIMPGRMAGSVTAALSKSDAHRVIICSALSQESTTIPYERVMSEDIKATVSCLDALGANISLSAGRIRIEPIDITQNFNKGKTLDCNESGTTLRFLLSLASALGGTFQVIGSGRLPERPLSHLITQLQLHGMEFSQTKLPMTVTGKLTPGKYQFPGDVSSQYISGLLVALPLLDGNSIINMDSQLQSSGYVDMTVKTLNEFGVNIVATDGSYEITGNQNYISNGKKEIEGDWSNAAFWLSAGALSTDGITVSGLDMNSLQRDKGIIAVLKSIGAHITMEGRSIKIKRKILKSIELDASQIPDLVPVLAALLSVCQGTSIIRNASRLRDKESDRLHGAAVNINALGGQVEVTGDGLKIMGHPKLNGGTVKSFDDHRNAMSMAILNAVCDSPIIIEDAQAVNKSYPDFFEDMKILGGECIAI